MDDIFHVIIQIIGCYWFGRGVARFIAFLIHWYQGDFIFLHLKYLTKEEKYRVSAAVTAALKEAPAQSETAVDEKWPEEVGQQLSCKSGDRKIIFHPLRSTSLNQCAVMRSGLIMAASITSRLKYCG